MILTDVNLVQQAVTAAARKHVPSVIRRVTPAVKAELIRLIQAPKTGRVYRVRGRFHQASAPGEPPANRSGQLVASIQESYPDALTGQIRIGAPYAGILEGKLNRPFARVAVRNVTVEFTRSRV